MERGSGHNDKLDLWKCVAIYSVIFIHILLPGQIGVAVNCLARFAVPLFFLSAGFFSWRSPPRVLARRTVRTAGLLLFACLALLGLGCAMAKHGGASMGAYLLGRFTWANAASLVLWQLFPLPYSWPLWFLAALLMIYLMWWGLTALLLGRLPHRLLAVLALGLLACMVMGLVLVWSNIERMDTTYFINIAQNELRERRALRAKLEVERERLLSPYELRRRAEEFGMREPRPGQVRRMEIH